MMAMSDMYVPVSVSADNLTYNVDVATKEWGGSNYKLIGSGEFTVNTTATSAALVGTISCSPSAKDKNCIIYIRVRDKAGKRAGYFYGSDAFFLNAKAANGSSLPQTTAATACIRYEADNGWVIHGNTAYGVYGSSIGNDGSVGISSRYNSAYSLTINGTYKVEVYKLTFPDGVSPFDE